MKVIEFWSLWWANNWPKGKPELYLSFEEWRRKAETYNAQRCDLESAPSIPS